MTEIEPSQREMFLEYIYCKHGYLVCKRCEEDARRRERLQIATAAMQGMIAARWYWQNTEEGAIKAFVWADAMLAEAGKEDKA